MIGDEEMITELHFDSDDNFIHRCCECGEEASFGFRVCLRRGALGSWYCAKHRRNTPSTANDANSASSGFNT